ncbi:MAG TPA: hypothetical protein V6C71_09420 [Coleofasciculaceae cyanobacterium]|jgi:hypothetical protein
MNQFNILGNRKSQSNLEISTSIMALAVLIGGISFFPRQALSQPKKQILVAQNTPSIRAASAQAETLYLNNDRTYAYNLIAQEEGFIGDVAIPVGATIVGKYVPAEGGLRYVAEAVTYDDYSYTIDASSEIIKDVKDPRDTLSGRDC